MRQATTAAPVLAALMLGILLALVYWPALTGTFVNYDDPLYITENQLIQQGFSWRSLHWSFTSISVGHWHPLTWLSHLAAIELFGLNPFGHHLLNLLLHYANALLLALLLCRLTGSRRRSWLVAALFALHPLNVESVAWVAERKGVLAAFFWLLAVLAYLRYTQAPALSRYLAALTFFALGLCSKAMVVTLPCVLLLLDFWPLGRSRLTASAEKAIPLTRLVSEKIPFFLLSALAGAGAIYAMWHGGAASSHLLLLRLQNVLRGYTGYLQKLFYPLNLSVSYPFVSSPSPWETAGFLAILLTVSLFVLVKMKQLPYLFTGWFWYLVTLAPVIGFLNLNLGQQTMPDRYAYLPLAGLLIMVVWGAGDLCALLRVPLSLRFTAAGLALFALGFIGGRQAAFWHDSVALFTHEVAINPTSSLAHTNLGNGLFERGEVEASFREFREALRIDPNNSDAWNNLGAGYGKIYRHGDAIQAYTQALAVNPLNALARKNLAMAYIGLNDMASAWKEYRILQKLHPEYAEMLRKYLR